MYPAESSPPADASFVPLTVDARGWTPWLVGAAVLFAWASLWNKLRVDWTINEQYEYGWFVPPLSLAVLAMRWKDRPPAQPRRRPAGGWFALAVFSGLFLIGPLRLVEGPNPDWRLVYWLHAAVAAGLSMALATWAGGWPWGRHFAFPILFLLVAVPWPSEPEQAVVQSLMRGVAAAASEVMAVLGVPAVAEGNVLSVRGQLVGVNEACSGIRSLQTTLMAALFLGELSRFTPGRRLALVAGGVLIALVANVFRSSLLVWITAAHGLAAMERWHDTTGLTALLVVFGSLLALASWLNRASAGPSPAATGSSAEPAAVPPVWVAVAALAWLGAVEVGDAWWYGAPAAGPLVTLPRWNVEAPADAPGLAAPPVDERTVRMLRYDRGLSLHWQRGSDAGPVGGTDCTLFFFRWEPGHASSLQADMHQPHICLTASGLKETADWGIRPVALPEGLTLPVRRYEFDAHGQVLYVFFVVWQDGVGRREGEEDEPGSRAARFRAVLERRPLVGRQTLEFLVTGPTTPEAADRVFAQELLPLIHRFP